MQVLGLYVPGLIGWLVTLEWRGGAFLCKFMRFIDAFVFSASSNIMVCIALYRLSALRYPLRVSAIGHSTVPKMVIAAWGIAAVSMFPQLYVWNQVEFTQVTQCVTIWTEQLNRGQELTVIQEKIMKFYSIQSSFIIFYLPLVVLVICYVLILKDIYKTLNTDAETSYAAYLSELSRNSSTKTAGGKCEKETFVAVRVRTSRGEEKFKRAKVRSLRITLLLILTYVVTWLPYNLLSWWMVFNLKSYIANLDSNYILNSLVVLNSVINPFIYGRWQGLKLIFGCRALSASNRKSFWNSLFHRK